MNMGQPENVLKNKSDDCFVFGQEVVNLIFLEILEKSEALSLHYLIFKASLYFSLFKKKTTCILTVSVTFHCLPNISLLWS